MHYQITLKTSTYLELSFGPALKRVSKSFCFSIAFKGHFVNNDNSIKLVAVNTIRLQYIRSVSFFPKENILQHLIKKRQQIRVSTENHVCLASLLSNLTSTIPIS